MRREVRPNGSHVSLSYHNVMSLVNKNPKTSRAGGPPLTTVHACEPAVLSGNYLRKLSLERREQANRGLRSA